jgi:hypothetical protein
MFKNIKILLLLYVVSNIASASPILFTDHTDFTDATTGLSYEGFETATSANHIRVDYNGGSFICPLCQDRCPVFFSFI